MRQPDVVHNLLHLGLHPLLGQALQTSVEPDVLLHRQPGDETNKNGKITTKQATNVPRATLPTEMLRDGVGCVCAYMLKSTLCWGQTPRFCRMALSSVRISFPRMYAVPEVGGNSPVRMDLEHNSQVSGLSGGVS